MAEPKKIDKLIKTILEAFEADAGVPFRYDHFSTAEAVPLPFAVYRRVAPEIVYADSKVYFHIVRVDVELYSADPDEMADLMEKLEALFDAQELNYAKTADTAYISSEDMYETLYEF